MSSESANQESRVLLLPPTRRDGEAIGTVLGAAGIACLVCNSIEELCFEIERGVGAVVVSEESLNSGTKLLIDCVRKQPVWSDLSILVLSSGGVESPRLTDILSELADVSVIERPTRITTLLSLVRSALRARARQYQVRAHLIEQKATEDRR